MQHPKQLRLWTAPQSASKRRLFKAELHTEQRPGCSAYRPVWLHSTVVPVQKCGIFHKTGDHIMRLVPSCEHGMRLWCCAVVKKGQGYNCCCSTQTYQIFDKTYNRLQSPLLVAFFFGSEYNYGHLFLKMYSLKSTIRDAANDKMQTNPLLYVHTRLCRL